MRETERKFLVSRIPDDLVVVIPDQEIRQTYLLIAGSDEVRVRERAGVCTLTIKSGTGLTRAEREAQVAPEVLARLTEPGLPRVEKTRRVVEAGGEQMGIDTLHGALEGLVVAEVEFDSEEASAAFKPPDWLGREVTYDDAYKNRSLAMAGRPANRGPAKPRCYMASPLGFDEGGRDYYRRVYLPALSAVVEPVDPWSWVTAEEVAAAETQGDLRDLALDIGRRNTEAIRSSDLLVAVLEGQEIDSGTAAEVGFAASCGIPCYGLRSDVRATGDLGMGVNLQVESFIVESGGYIARSLEELVDGLASALGSG